MLDTDCTRENLTDESEDDMNTSKKRKREPDEDDDEEDISSNQEDDESEDEQSDGEDDDDDEEEEGEEEEEEVDGEEESDDDYESGEEESNSDGESGSDEETDSDEGASSKKSAPKAAKEAVLSDSSTEEKSENREVCAICLSYMKGEIGSPELCDHSFCLECILEWARTNNSCPQDRTQFLQVFVRKKVKGKIIRTITVAEVKPDDIPQEDDDDPIFCEVCGRCDREDTLLLCDGCDTGHHLECLTPPLDSVPIEEWFCPECQALNRERAPQEERIELREVTALIDDARVGTTRDGQRRPRPIQSRQLPRTRASERVRRRITRARTTRGRLPYYSSSDSENVVDENDDGGSTSTLNNPEVSSSSVGKTSGGLKLPPKKKRKVTIKRKRKVKRKTKAKSKRKTTTKTRKRKTTTKKRKTTAKTKRKVGKRKSTKRKKTTKGRKRKGKKKPVPQAIITPKARLAEALGIRPLKNPWQLSLPAMTGGRSQGGANLANQRWRAGLPSLSLLGSNSELDYVSEPDEFGDAILAEGVAQARRPASTLSLARRKALAADVLSRTSRPLLGSLRSPLPSLPLSDSNVSSVSDLLDDIIQSQNQLHRNSKQNLKDSRGEGNSMSVFPSRFNANQLAKTAGGGPDSPIRESNESDNQSPPREQNSQPPSYSSNGTRAADSVSGGFSFMKSPTDGDPTGSKAYSSYLREHSQSGEASPPRNLSDKDGKKKTKKNEKKSLEDEDIDLYSDIEPEIPEEIEDEEESENEKDVEGDSNKEQEEQIEENESPLSGDELIIDDSIRQEAKEKSAVTPAPKLDISGSTNSDNEVGSSNLPGLNDFELEAVSDTDTHEMDKSMNSSISLSDSNMGDPEVTSSTNELNLNESEVNKTPSNRVVQLYNRPLQNRFTAVNATPMGMGLEGLETENISDNEEICFEDNFGNEDDNIEEGEIPNENPHRALPANRPKINIQLRKVIEVSSPNKEFDGECEEGEIVDEAAAKKEKKREKAKREVEEVVNAQSDEPKEDGDKENVNPEPAASLTLLSEPDLSSPEKLGSPHKTSKLKDKKEKDKLKDKEKEKEKEKVKEKPREKDVAFKKVSRNTKVRNYRDNDKGDLRNRRRGSRDRSYSRERAHSRDRAHSKDRLRDRERNRESPRSLDRYRNHSGRRRERDRDKDRKKEPKRKEMERYNVRQMINKKEEERKKKDEFGRDVALREVRPSRSRSRSRSKGRGRRRSESRSKKRAVSGRNRLGRAKKSFSRSRSKSRTFGRTRRKRRSYSSSSSSSSSSSTSSSSSYTSSSSSSRSRSRSRRRSRDRKRHTTRSRSKSLVKKKVEKKKPVAKPKEKMKKVVVAAPKKKDEKKKEKRKEKEFDPKPRKKRKREKTPLQSKEVYQAGGSIMVSVNFSRNKENKDPKKKKDKDVKMDEIKKRKKQQQQQQQQKKGPASATSPYRVWSSRARSASPGGKHTPLQDEPMWSPDNLRHQSRASGEVVKTPEVIDLDVIMVTPPPQEPILISDSEEEEEGITRLPPDLGAQQQLSPLSRSQGPKTPPEPGVKFTLSTKQVLKPITNPLRDEEEEDHSVPVPTRGPNTPPGPPPESDESVGRPKSPTRRIPRSPVGTPPASSPEPDVYDPFEPTKSPSPPTRSPQQEARVSSSDQTDQNLLLTSPAAPSPTKKVPSPPPPPLPVGDPPQKEERPPEPQQKPPEDEASSTAIPAVVAPTTALPPPATAPPPIVPHSAAVSSVGVTTLPGVVPLSSAPHTLQPISTPSNSQPLNTMQQIFAGLPANVANILYPAALAAAAMRGATNNLLRPPGTQPLVPPDFSRPPPSTTNILSRPPPSTISPLKGDKGKVTQNGQNFIDVIDMDLGSPTSPDSSDASDMFEPPSPHNIVSHDKTSPRKQRLAGPQRTSPIKGVKHHDKFDALFGSSNDSRAKMSHKMKAVLNSSKGIKLKGKKLDVEDDIPSSAVDLQVKEKLLKKVQRQERVVDEVKLCLKPFYNKKTISKEDYKDIMKKCVQKVCHNKSGEINPHKIRGLVEGYIKRVKYYRKKQGGGNPNTGILSQLKSGPVLPPTVNDPPPPGFGLLSKTHLKMKP